MTIIFVLDFLAMSVIGLALDIMVVIMKALLLLYNIKTSSIHEALNVKDLCVLEKSCLEWLSFLYNTPFSTTNIGNGGCRPYPWQYDDQQDQTMTVWKSHDLLY